MESKIYFYKLRALSVFTRLVGQRKPLSNKRHLLTLFSKKRRLNDIQEVSYSQKKKNLPSRYKLRQIGFIKTSLIAQKSNYHKLTYDSNF